MRTTPFTGGSTLLHVLMISFVIHVIPLETPPTAAPRPSRRVSSLTRALPWLTEQILDALSDSLHETTPEIHGFLFTDRPVGTSFTLHFERGLVLVSIFQRLDAFHLQRFLSQCQLELPRKLIPILIVAEV